MTPGTETATTGTRSVPGAAERRLTEIAGAVAADPAAAAARVWDWLGELRDRAENDREAVAGELDALFRAGRIPATLDGPTDGMLVMTTINPLVDPAVRLVTRLWMPWRGKRFDLAAASGENRLAATAELPSRLLWPLYSMRDAADGKLAFDFETYIAPGALDQDRDVLVIDYSKVEGNPRLIIRSIRDELVEIVPGAYLGKILFHLPSERYELIGYFGLRTPVGEH